MRDLGLGVRELASGATDEQSEIRSHRDLSVWRKAMDIARDVYRFIDLLPKKEDYRISSQLVRAAISIPANIAEGNARGSRNDYADLVSIARVSAGELT